MIDELDGLLNRLRGSRREAVQAERNYLDNKCGAPALVRTLRTQRTRIRHRPLRKAAGQGASQYVRKGKMEDSMKAVQVLLDFQAPAGRSRPHRVKRRIRPTTGSAFAPGRD